MPTSSTAPDDTTDLAQLAADWEQRSARERLEAARERFGDGLVMSTSFGVQSAVLLHLATRVWPEIPVVFVDTGYLFPETYRFARDLTERLHLNLRKYQPLLSAAEHEALHGREWEGGEEALARYNFARKVEPMNRALADLGATAWITGLRRVQAKSREKLPVVARQQKTWKVYPIIDWTDRDIFHYLQEHELPYHPLWDQGYVSVGDWHSSAPLEPGMEAEETRFNGVKRECGLHELSGRVDFQI